MPGVIHEKSRPEIVVGAITDAFLKAAAKKRWVFVEEVEDEVNCDKYCVQRWQIVRVLKWLDRRLDVLWFRHGRRTHGSRGFTWAQFAGSEVERKLLLHALNTPEMLNQL